MTEEEIKKIARGYWDSQNPTNKLKDHPEAKMIVDAMQSVLSGPIDELVEDYTKFLTWVLRDYCIVPKDEARKLRQIVTDNADSLDHGLIDGLSDWVEINLDSSLFEEDKK